MAVPKKRVSKSKKNKRKTVWKNKAIQQGINSISLANLQKWEELEKN